jgi:hypothetical protein
VFHEGWNKKAIRQASPIWMATFRQVCEQRLTPTGDVGPLGLKMTPLWIPYRTTIYCKTTDHRHFIFCNLFLLQTRFLSKVNSHFLCSQCPLMATRSLCRITKGSTLLGPGLGPKLGPELGPELASRLPFRAASLELKGTATLALWMGEGQSPNPPSPPSPKVSPAYV